MREWLFCLATFAVGLAVGDQLASQKFSEPRLASEIIRAKWKADRVTIEVQDEDGSRQQWRAVER